MMTGWVATLWIVTALGVASSVALAVGGAWWQAGVTVVGTVVIGMFSMFATILRMFMWLDDEQ